MTSDKEYKQKSLFDHLNQIKTEKRIDYYDLLNEDEQKNFNQYLILIGLSMDKECIEEVSFISKYLYIVPNKQFYKICCDLIPYSKSFNKWIKSKKNKFDNKLLNLISKYYEISLNDSIEYCELMFNTNNLDKIENILSKFGLADKDIKKMLIL